LFLPQRTCLVFVRNVRVGGRCLHVIAGFATLAAAVTPYDFDPTTFSKKSGMTAGKIEEATAVAGGRERLGGELNGVSADSRRA
jgi:hypothetical protein